jgi:hypothetical protein
VRSVRSPVEYHVLSLSKTGESERTLRLQIFFLMTICEESSAISILID